MATVSRILATAILVLSAACQNEVTPPSGGAKEAPAPQRQMGRGFIWRGGAPFEVVFEVQNGRGVFEGDIDLGPVDRIAPTREALRVPSLGVVTGDQGRRWSYGIVPYVVSPSFPNPQRAYDAMAHIESKVSDVQFVPRQSYHTSYIIFVPSISSSFCGQSEVGRNGGAQQVVIVNTCGVGVVIHELGHALGFWHEQSRCDRDSYVQIQTNNIQDGASSQFTKMCSGADDLGSYDEGSIMHYDRFAFGKVVGGVTQQTILSLRGLEALMGQRDSLSTMDKYTINAMYPAPPVNPPWPNNVTYPSGTPTISWGPIDPPSEFSVRYLVTYNYYNYSENWSDVHNHSTAVIGSTTGLSLADPGRTYTGISICSVFNYGYDELFLTYEYEVTAVHGNGQTVVYMLAAAVGPEGCW